MIQRRKWGRPETWKELREDMSAMEVDAVLMYELEETFIAQTIAGQHAKRNHPDRKYRAITAAGKLYIIRAK